MIKDSVFAALELADARRAERRRFLKLAGAGTAVAGGLALLSACGSDDGNSTDPSPTPSPSPTATSTGVATDVGILQLALNLEYLEAQFYSFAAFGQGLPAASVTGTVGGTPGAVTGGRQVQFTDPLIASYAREIAADEIAHVNFLRNVLTQAGSTLVIAQPAINIDGGTTGAFTRAARAAKIVGDTDTFDPYASDENFLLAAYLFEDVGVTAYKGASPLIGSAVYLEAAAGILAAEAYHAGLIRAELYRLGRLATGTPNAITKANAISDARDSLDGGGTTLIPTLNELDEGITKTVNGAQVANIVPADANGIAYSRSTLQVHNIAYLTNAAAVSGGFFPSGTNNSIAALRSSGNFVPA